MRKQEHVPETKEADVGRGPNREQRRHPEQIGRAEDEPLAREPRLVEQDVPSPRTKSSGHRKKTADKWNQ
jgi:hypothetical protein